MDEVEMVYVNLLKSSLLAGFFPMVAAPILWPFVIYLSVGRVSVEALLYSLAPVALFGLIAGLTASVFIGFPALIVLSVLKLNRIKVAAFLGALCACLVLGVLGPSFDHDTNAKLWPSYLYLSFLGAGCGSLGSYLSNRDSMS